MPSGYIIILMGYRKGKGGQKKKVAVREYAHRLVCWAFNGPPAKGQECAHLCGCVNCLAPMHLKWASREQNNRMRAWHAGEGSMGDVCPSEKWE